MRAAQSDLVRVVAAPGRAQGQAGDGQPSVARLDLDRSGHGRGAYLHPSLSCLELAERRRVFARALRRPGVDTGTLRQQMTARWPDT
jgi:predicted RNA-binding protein YlxR (DUF448 family)